MKSRFLSVVVLAFLAGCAAPIKVESEMQLPARAPEATRLKRIAVLRFERLGNFDITAEVEAQLANARVGGATYFTVVERARLNEALKEMRLAESGALNAASAAKLGQMVAANGLYMGAITRDDIADQNYTETRSVCGQFEEKRDKKGNVSQGACQRYIDRQVNCTRRMATFEFVPKLMDVASGTIIYSRTVAGTSSAKNCSDDGSPAAARDDLRSDARNSALKAFREDIAPFTRTLQIAFLSNTDGIASPTAKERFEGSMAFARERRLDRACEIWAEISQTERFAPSVTYNRGICAEVSGNLDLALVLYTEADRLLSRPDRTIGEGLTRVRTRQAADRSLRSGVAQDLTATERQASRTSTQLAHAPSASVSLAPAAGGAPAAVTLTLTRDEVIRGQSRLRALGFDVGTPDGVAGARTRAALRAFQAARGLAATGDFDAATLKALEVK